MRRKIWNDQGICDTIAGNFFFMVQSSILLLAMQVILRHAEGYMSNVWELLASLPILANISIQLYDSIVLDNSIILKVI